MTSDAMDWLPLPAMHPPSYLNPYYSDPHYMPGAWPAVPNLTTYTADRKRKSTSIFSAAKRVCFGLCTLVADATATVTKPTYVIIQEFRAKLRAASRIPRRRSSVGRRPSVGSPEIGPALIYQAFTQLQLDAEEEQQHCAAQNQTTTPTSTPPAAVAEYYRAFAQLQFEEQLQAAQNLSTTPTSEPPPALVAFHQAFAQLQIEKEQYQNFATQDQSTTPTSTPPSTRKAYFLDYDLGSGERTSDSAHNFNYSGDTEFDLSDQITDTDSSFYDSETTDTTPATTNSTYPNTPHCDGYDVPKSHVINSPCVAAARAGIKRRRSEDLDPEEVYIVTQNQVEASKFYMGRPKRKMTRRSNPFEGIPQHASSLTQPAAAMGNALASQQDAKSTMHPWSVAKPINASPPDSPTIQLHEELSTQPSISGYECWNQIGEKIPETKQPKRSRLHNDRWFSVPIMDLFSPRGQATDESLVLTKAEPEAQTPSGMSGMLSQMSKLFYTSDARNTPPPVRSRSVVPAQNLSHPNNGLLPTPAEEVVGSTAKNQKSLAATKVKNDSTPKDVMDTFLDSFKVSTWTQAEVDEIHRRKSIDATASVKPTGESSQDAESKRSLAETTHPTFETPSERLSKLNLNAVDIDTPKAGYHSDTKTARRTRYREVYERLQKAKLEEYELVPITDAWDKKVRSAIRTGIPDYLGPHDLARVVPQYASRGQDNWLNDETINKYLEIVAAHGRKSDRPEQIRTHHAFNNFFYNNLRDKGPESVLKWSKRAKIGGKSLAQVEKVFVPVNSGAHWTLAVVEPKEKRITHYNSMRGAATGTRACEDLKRWVAAELRGEFKEDEWAITAVGQSPQQTNSDDCGVFTITSARQIMLGFTPMSYGSSQIPAQRVRIVAELINRGLLRSTEV